MNNTMNICVHVFLWTYVFIALGILMEKVELLSHVVLFIILRNAKLLPQSVPFSLSTEVYEDECITFMMKSSDFHSREKGNKNILTVFAV